MKMLMNLLSVKSPSRSRHEDGFAAFFVTFVVMIVLSLIVVGFAANARRDQQNALNNQLGTAAYYAAESGINDAYSIITKDQALGLPIVPQTSSCTTDDNNGDTYGTNIGDNQLSSTSGYSCLLVNPAPPSLLFQPVETGEGEVMPLIGKPATSPNGATVPIRSMTVSWQTTNAPGTNFSACPDPTTQQGNNLPPQTTYIADCPDAGILQLDMLPDTPTAMSQITTGAATSIFLQPSKTNGVNSTTPQAVTNGDIIPVQCSPTLVTTATISTEYYCTVTIDLTTIADNSVPGSYYLRITPFYEQSSIEVEAQDAGGQQLGLANAQASIDATGNANDVLKRIEERVCISNLCNSAAPTTAVQSATGIEKQFTTRPDCTTSSSITNGCPASGGGNPANPTTPTNPATPRGSNPPNGTAKIGQCPPGPSTPTCPNGPAGQTPLIFYNTYLENLSYNPGVSVISCTWNWGDGSPDSTTSCDYGQYIDHCYGPPYVAGTYKVKLTVLLSNGTSPSKTYPATVPYTKSDYTNPGCSTPVKN
jgi:hypothetical protein